MKTSIAEKVAFSASNKGYGHEIDQAVTFSKNLAIQFAIRTTTRLSLERFEDRINMSGFGPEDGAMIVEPWAGKYDEVRIQPWARSLPLAPIQPPKPWPLLDMVEGDADTSYGVGGKLACAWLGKELANGLVLQADGKAVISYYRTWHSSLQHGVAQVNANGSLDTSFGGGGWSIVDVRTTDASPPYSGGVVLQSNGKIVTADSSGVIVPSGPPWGIIARFSSGGALDSGKNGFGDVSNGKASATPSLSRHQVAAWAAFLIAWFNPMTR